MPIKIKSTGGGSVSIDVPNTGSDFTLTAPANNATLFTTAGGTITGNVAFTSNNVTIGGQAVSPVTGMRNRIINGDMRIDQRNNGGSVTASGSFPVDRFYIGHNFDGTVTAQRSTVAPPGFSNSLLLTVTSPDTSLASGQFFNFRQRIEGLNVADLGFGTVNAKTVTLSFWVRSSVTGTYVTTLTNTPDNRLYPATYTIDAANTWEYKSLTIPGDTTGTWSTDNTIGIQIQFQLALGSSFQGSTNMWTTSTYGPSGMANWISTNGATFYITGVQLEEGSVATPFERRPYGLELYLCYRYYQGFSGTWKNYRYYPTVTIPGNYGIGSSYFHTPMRSTPTVITYSESGVAGRFTINRGGAFVSGAIVEYDGFCITNGTGGSITSVNEITYYYTASAEL